MIKVLMVVTNLIESDGVANFAMNYFRRIEHNDIKMDFLIYSRDKISKEFQKEILDAGSKIYSVPSVKHLNQHFRECKKILSENHYDIIHDNSLIITLPLMWCAKNAVRVRILHSHNSKMGETVFKEIRNKLALPLLTATATNYVACSDLAGKAMFGKRKFTFVPNTISSRYKYNPEVRKSVRQKFGVQGKLLVGTIARVAEQKNPEFALKIFSELLKIEPNAEYWWIGDGPLLNKMREMAIKKKIDSQVHFFGNRNDVEELYQALDVFLLPSKFEGLGIALVEAQAFGVPCIVSNDIPKVAIYTDLVTQLSIKSNSSEWAKNIAVSKRVFRKREEYNTALRKSVFSDKLAGENLKNLYIQLLGAN